MVNNAVILIDNKLSKNAMEKVIKKYNINTIFFSSTYKEKICDNLWHPWENIISSNIRDNLWHPWENIFSSNIRDNLWHLWENITVTAAGLLNVAAYTLTEGFLLLT